MTKAFFSGMVLAFISLVSAPGLAAQPRQEIGLAAGGGEVMVNGSSNASPVVSLAYRLHVTEHFSAEGALDFFGYRYPAGPDGQPSDYLDDYSGAEAALIYHFRDSRETRKWIPFAAVGLGRTTTDFTEIPATTYYRFGAGVSYNFSDRFGTRVEIRNEAITDLSSNGRISNLPSIRAGIVLRF